MTSVPQFVVEELPPPVRSPRVLAANGATMILGLALAEGCLCGIWRGDLQTLALGMLVGSPFFAMALFGYGAVFHPRPWVVRTAAFVALLPGFVGWIGLIGSFTRLDDSPAAFVGGLLLSVGILGASLWCFLTNWSWHHQITHWERKCLDAGVSDKAKRARRGDLRVSLRELMGATLLLALILGIARSITAPYSPRYYDPVSVENAPVAVPEDARDIRYSIGAMPGYGRSLVLEFSCSEESFRKWRSTAPTPVMVTVVATFAGEERYVARGWEYQNDSWRAVYDLNAGRVYYFRWSEQ